jgi:DNA-binding NarL/FixJ family response regulator
MRLLLVDDHPLFLEGLRYLLTARGYAVVGTARDGLDALSQVRAQHPDLILMDIQIPRCNGLDAARLIKAEFPEVRVVILTVSASDQDLFEAIRIGVSGYLLKTQDTSEFYQALTDIGQGQVAFAAGLAQRVMDEFSRLSEGPTQGWGTGAWEPVQLSERQMQVLTLVANGMHYKEVGCHLGVTERTVKYHMGEILALLHLRNRVEAVAFARAHGMSGRSRVL